MKKSRIFALACAVLVFSSISFCLISPVRAAPVSTQLCLLLDDSSSIGAANWTIIKNGVGDAIRNHMPHDGSVELTVVVFPASDTNNQSALVVSPTVITTANYNTVATFVEGLGGPYNPPGDETSTPDALYLGWKTVTASGNFVTGVRQVINLATDGVPNVRNFNASTDLDSSGLIDAFDDIIATEQNYMIPGGLDELDMEAINITGTDATWFRLHCVYPQPGNFAPPYVAGWERLVDNATEYSTAVQEKFEEIVGGPPQLIIDKTGPVIASPEQTFTYTITITNIGGSTATTVVLNDTLPALVSYRGSNPVGTTNDTTHSVQWSLPDIVATGSIVVELTVQVDPGVALGTILTNVANVTWYTLPGIPMGPANASWVTIIRLPQTVGGYVLESSFAFWLPLALAIVFAFAATIIVQRNRYRLNL